MDLNSPQGVQPVQTPQPAQPMQVNPMPTGPIAQTQQTTPPQAPKSNKKLMIVLLFALLLLVVIAMGAYAFLMNKGNSSTAGQTYVTPAKQEAKVTAIPTPEVSVSSTSELDSAITEVNAVSTSSIDSELNQAALEAKNL